MFLSFKNTEWVGNIAFLVILVVFFYPGWSEHIRYSSDAYYFNGDARQHIAPFVCYHKSLPCDKDYQGNYYRSTFPMGYAALYTLPAPWLDPRTLSKIIPYLLTTIMLIAMWLSARQLAGSWAAWGTVILCLSADVYISHMTGGFPRAFGFPLISLLILALVTNRPLLLATIPILGSAFYYPLAVLGGLVLSLYLLTPFRYWLDITKPESWKHKLTLLFSVGLITVLFILPGMIAVTPYKPMITPKDEPTYPEATASGRYDYTADSPLIYRRNIFVEGAGNAIKALLPRHKTMIERLKNINETGLKILSALSLLICLVGWALLTFDRCSARRLILLYVGTFIAWLAAVATLPHLLFPQRYLIYTTPLVVALLLPASIQKLIQSLPSTRLQSLAPALCLLLIIGLVVVFDARGPEKRGFGIYITPKDRPLYSFIADLEDDTLVAGWPEGIVENIPYLTGHRVLFNYETHQAYHAPYADEMRRRANAFFNAYLSASREPLVRLHNEFGVTHLILDRRHFDGETPRYFKPFDTTISQLDSVSSKEQIKNRLFNSQMVVFSNRHFVVLDLRKLVDEKINENNKTQNKTLYQNF